MSTLALAPSYKWYGKPILLQGLGQHDAMCAWIGDMANTYFQPMAKPHDGSKNRLEKAENDPATGKVATSSPKLCIVQN